MLLLYYYYMIRIL